MADKAAVSGAEHEAALDKQADREANEDALKDQQVPYSRFDEVNKRAKHAEEELSDLRNKIIEFEDRDKSEVDRERSARERAESQLGELLGKVTSLEKGSWVRSAASELNFHDPEDAVAHLNGQLGSLEDQREAKRLVEKLAKSREHLVSKPEKKARPSIGRVMQGDEVQNGQPRQAPSPQQRAADAEMQFAEGLREQLAKFLPENSDSYYSADQS